MVMRSTCAYAITLQSPVPLVKLKTVGTKVGMWQDSLPAHVWLACPRFLPSVGVWLGATLLTPLVASLSQLSKVRLTKNSYIRCFKLGISPATWTTYCKASGPGAIASFLLYIQSISW